MLRKGLALAACVLIAGAACSSAAKPAGAVDVAIGVDLPLTGADGFAGRAVLNGIQFYVHQHPSVDGRRIRLVVKDDATNGIHDPGRGAVNMRALIGEPDVLGVIGPFDSNVARVEIPLANQAFLAMISPSNSDTCLTKDVLLPSALNLTAKDIKCSDAFIPSARDLRPGGPNNYFRLATTDDLEGPAAADFAYTNLRLRRVAVMSDFEAYGQELASGFAVRFMRNGGSVVARKDFAPAASPDFRAFLKQAKADGAQAIYFGGVTSTGACTARHQMIGIFDDGAGAPFIGGDGIAEDPACVTAAVANAVGMYATVPAVNADSRPSAQAAIKAFKAAFPEAADYGAYTMAAYDAAGVLVDSIHRAFFTSGGRLPTRAEVVAQLAATSYPGALGPIAFDAKGDITTRIVSVYAALSIDPLAAWPLQAAIDYSSKPPA